jgi:threonine dehydratase
MNLEVTRKDIRDAAKRSRPHVRMTPVIELGDPFDAGFRLSLKLEHLQVTGSFKPRGAFSLLCASQVPRVGVAAASGGNFGIAAAYACSVLGHQATIFVPETSPAEKIERIGEHGADVRCTSGFYDEALAACEDFVAESGAFVAHAYDQREVMAGQGTVGLEITEQLGEVDSILVAVGGGGLIGGIASWCRDDYSVIATEPELCSSLHAARSAGHPVKVSVGGVASSSLGSASVGEYPWHANRWIDDAVLVTDEQIVEAQHWIWNNTRLVVEPAAATTVAALMAGSYTPQAGEHVVAVLSGGNVAPGSVG